MFRYFYRIFDKHRKPVAAIAVFTGKDGKQLTDSYKYVFMNTRLQYQYNTLCIHDYSDDELKASKNPFAWVILAAKSALLTGRDVDRKLLAGKLFIFRKLYENGLFEKRKLQAILAFLDNYVRFKKSETKRIFEKQVDDITGKKNTMDIFEQVREMKEQELIQKGRRKGLKEGRQKGLEEGVEKSVRALLANTEFSETKIATLVGVSIAFVKKLSKEIRAK
jgi:hypothetical protein